MFRKIQGALGSGISNLDVSRQVEEGLEAASYADADVSDSSSSDYEEEEGEEEVDLLGNFGLIPLKKEKKEKENEIKSVKPIKPEEKEKQKKNIRYNSDDFKKRTEHDENYDDMTHNLINSLHEIEEELNLDDLDTSQSTPAESWLHQMVPKKSKPSLLTVHLRNQVPRNEEIRRQENDEILTEDMSMNSSMNSITSDSYLMESLFESSSYSPVVVGPKEGENIFKNSPIEGQDEVVIMKKEGENQSIEEKENSN